MKTKWMAMVAMLMVCQLGFAQKNASQLYEQFKNEKGVDCVNIGKLAMGFAGITTNTHGVSSVRVLDLEDSPASVRESFSQSCKNLELGDYEPFLTSNEDGEHTKILTKMNGDFISEMLIITTGKGDCSMVWLTGKMNPNEVKNETRNK
jgi:hypothetical protein